MSTNNTHVVVDVDVATARQMVSEGAVLLDIREPHEWEAGHSPDAVFLPLAWISDARASIPAGTRVVVTCRSGNRSRVGTEVLLAHGYEAFNLAGGMQAWVDAGETLVDMHGNQGAVV
ncbi:MAG: rhodanese-like domain-containing protein [Actinomycetes bacterium]